MIYFWNIEALKDDIVSGNFTQRDRFVYLLIYVGLTSFFMEFTPLFEEASASDIFYAIFSVAVTILGTYYLYIQNGKEEGVDFLGKYFSVTWVVFIRYFLFFLLWIFLISFIVLSLDISDKSFDFIMDVSSYLFLIAIYWSAGRHIAQIRQRMNAATSSSGLSA